MTFTKEELSTRFGAEVTAVKKVSEKEYEITVREMPDFPADCDAKFRWMEADLNDEFVAAIKKWREEYVAKYGPMDASCFPDVHHTLIFGHCPAAALEVARLQDDVLKINEPIFYTDVEALGPEGKENCWAAVTTNARIRHVMLEAKVNANLNTNHPSYQTFRGWEKTGGDFPSIKAHVTLVRNLTPEQMRERGTPVLGRILKGRFVRVREWAGVKDASGVTFKFTRTCHYEKVYS